MSRPTVNIDATSGAIDFIVSELERRLEQKGRGAFASRHELLGIVSEEYKEVVDAVHAGDLVLLRMELADLAVACAFGIACIDTRSLDW